MPGLRNRHLGVAVSCLLLSACGSAPHLLIQGSGSSGRRVDGDRFRQLPTSEPSGDLRAGVYCPASPTTTSLRVVPMTTGAVELRYHQVFNDSVFSTLSCIGPVCSGRSPLGIEVSVDITSSESFNLRLGDEPQSKGFRRAAIEPTRPWCVD